MKNELGCQLQMAYSQKLKSMVGSELKIRINNNRSTMLHVRRNDEYTDVSLHHMFMSAPPPVQQALVSFIKDQDLPVPTAVQAYIDNNIVTLDYSKLLNPKQMSTAGSVYDLQTLYNKINNRYFGGELDLKITWFGQRGAKVRTKCTLGLYHDMVKLVKINRLLDTAKVPEYVIEYVIYHEMVHAVCPAYKDEKGRNCIHTKEFKERERNFLEFEEAREWLNVHHTNFFVPQRMMKSNGRTQQMGEHQAPQEQSGCSQGQSIYTYL